MKKKIKNFIQGSLVVVISALIIFTVVKAGTITPPSGTPSATMYTLTDIYRKLTENATFTATEPSGRSFTFSDALGGTHYTLTQIYNVIPTINASKVLSDTTYLGVTGSISNCGSEGSQSCYATGTYYAGTSKTPSNSTTSQSAGYYPAFNLATVDTDLALENIKKNTAIFGITGALYGDTDPTKVLTVSGGTYNATNLTADNIRLDVAFGVADTGTLAPAGTAATTDCLLNTTFYSGNSWTQKTGSIAAGANVSGADGSISFSIPNGYYSSKTCTAQDSDLTEGNVKKDVGILGVTGTLAPANGASESLTATDANCGGKYFGSSASSWTPSTGTLCTGFCQTCSAGTCVNASNNTDEYGHCGGSSCCGYCNGSGGCSYVIAGGTCTLPGTSCSGSYKCDGSGSCGLWACGDAIEYGGQSYDTVLIGSQCWLAKNLNIGTKIAGTSSQTNNSIVEKYCYNDEEGNCTTDGGLYQWNEAMQYSTVPGVQGICPSGWHIPTHDEFTTLELAVCTSGTCATDFPYDQSTTGWRGTNEGTKLKSGGSSGFNGLLAGYRHPVGSFNDRGTRALIWSSLGSGSDAWTRYLHSGYATVARGTDGNAYGFSVRCLKD